ncbi:MAG: diguanylate cyclase [Deltaproteobacteria bacterium]|nr:diguanylate cyclase [Deltaproteobacteria bacterium]
MPLLITAAAAAALAYYFGRRHRILGAKALMAAVIAGGFWALTNACQVASPDLPAKIFWAKVQYFGITTLPLAMFVFALQYSGRERWITRRNIGLLLIVPVVSLILVWTNSAHHLIWTRHWLDLSGPFPVEALTHGAWFWVWAAYAYLQLLLATIWLVQSFLRSPRLYRRQAAVVLVGLAFPWVGNGLYLFGASPLPHIDLTPIAFILTALALAWGLYRYHLSDIMPVARLTVLEGLNDALFVLDTHNRLVDLNPAAQRLIDCPAKEVIGQTAAQAFSARPRLVERFIDIEEGSGEFILGQGEARRYYDLRVSPLADRKNRPLGRLSVIRDITERKIREMELLQTTQRLNDANEILHRLSVIDPLTEIANRRYFDNLLAEEWARGRRNNHRVSMIMVDIDFFKDYNDTLGHLAGDEGLIKVAKALSASIRRPGDSVARFGGEEFAAILPTTDLAGAIKVAEAMRQEVEDLALPHPKSETGDHLTVSVGVASLLPADGINREALIAAADKALYQAKENGRNRTVGLEE